MDQLDGARGLRSGLLQTSGRVSALSTTYLCLYVLKARALGSDFPDAPKRVFLSKLPASLQLQVLIKVGGVEVILAEMVWFMALRTKSGDGKNGEGIAQIESFLEKSP